MNSTEPAHHLLDPDECEAVHREIAPHLYRTPLLRARSLEGCIGGGGIQVYVKLESEQVTGSFKARGALAKLSRCKARGCRNVTTASTGNHALAVLHALRKVGGVHGTIYLPTTASRGKVEKIQSICAEVGADLKFSGADCMEAEIAARRAASTATSAEFVSPYNDAEVILGQATVAVEASEQFRELNLPPPDAVFVAVGGGGLVSGVSGYFKAKFPGSPPKIIGCQPACDPAMLRCVEAGEVVEIQGEPTLSDGTAGNVEMGSVTLQRCAAGVDVWVEVTEKEIASALRSMLDNENKLVEGAAAVAVAGLLKCAGEWKGKTVMVVACGGNVGSDKLQKVFSMTE